MSILMTDIAHLNDHLFHENKKLKAQAEYDSELIRDLGKQLKAEREKNARLEAQLRELQNGN